MNGNGNRGQYEPTTRWGPVAVIGAVVLMIVLLVVLFAALSGGSESGGQDRQSAADAPRVSNPAAVSEETTSEETTSEETTSETPEEQGDTSAGDEVEGDGELSASGEESATNQPVSEDSGVSEEEQGSEGDRSGQEGAVNEPAGFDPLNKNAEPGDLTETDESRVRLTVSEFVNSAYGFVGDDKTAYARGVEQHVILPDFYDSPAGDAITQRVQNFDAGEVSGAVKLNGFEIETTEPERVAGTATFVTGESYTSNGDVKGAKREYSQRITLVPQGEIYKVSAASEPKESGG